MIAIIDYDSGNLRSMAKALEEVGAKVRITNEPKTMARARAIVFPGVGAFYHGMKVLKNKGLLSPLIEAIKEGKPFLGVCLRLQLLFSESEEHGRHYGLGVIKGRVKRFPPTVKIPHLGWNQVKITPSPKLWLGLRSQSNFGEGGRVGDKIFNGLPDQAYFYFVHSYYVEPEDKDIIKATTSYGLEFPSVIARDNIWGIQFHPEKSSTMGLKILENFYRYAG